MRSSNCVLWLCLAGLIFLRGVAAAQGLPATSLPPSQGASVSQDQIKALVKLLHCPNDGPCYEQDVKAHDSAIDSLVKIGGAAVPALTDVLQNDVFYVRFSAAKALGRIGPPAASAVPALIEALKAPTILRRDAARALEGIGPSAEASVPALMEALKDGDPDVPDLARVAASALSKISPATSLMEKSALVVRAKYCDEQAVRVLQSIDFGALPASVNCWPKDVMQSVLQAAKLGNPPFIQPLNDALDAVDPVVSSRNPYDYSPYERRAFDNHVAIVRKLSELKDPSSIPHLINALSVTDESWGIPYVETIPLPGRRARESLVAFGAAALPALFKVVEDRNAYVRGNAIYAIATILGSNDPRALELVEKALRDPDVFVRSCAVGAAGNLGPGALRLVTGVLSDHTGYFDYLIRIEAVYSLGRLGAIGVPGLLKELNEFDEYIQDRTVDTLKKIGAPAVPALVDALKNSSRNVRWQAASALGQMGARDGATVAALIGALDDSESIVRFSAAESLGKMGRDAAPAVSALRKRLGARESIGTYYVEALEKIGAPAIGPLLDAVRTEDITLRDAVVALGKIGVPAAIGPLLDAARTEDITLRYAVENGLVSVGVAALPALVEASKDGDGRIRALAVACLGRIGSPSAPVIVALLTASHDKDSSVSSPAESSLKTLIAKSRPSAISSMAFAIASDDPHVRVWAAEALGRIDAPAASAVAALMEALKDRNPGVRSAAATNLGRFGPSASAAVATLAEELDDNEGSVRTASASALGRIGASAAPAVPGLIRHLRDRGDTYLYIEALGGIGDAAETAVPTLVEFLRSKDWAIQALTVRALGKIGDLRALPALLKELDDSSDLAWYSKDKDFAQAFANMGPSAIPVLINALRHGNSHVRSVMVEALAIVGASAVPALVETLTGYGSDVRSSAASCLGKIGPRASDAVPMLMELLKDRNQRVRDAAADALKKIGSA
jgi:HEAT repeat protein